MKIVVHEPYLKVLENWDSIERTLRTAEDCCNEAGDPLIESDIQTYKFCAIELEKLIPALEHLHRQIKAQKS